MNDDQGTVYSAVQRLLGPLLASAIGVGFAFALYAYVRNDFERDARLRFDRQAADAKHIIERRLRSYVDVTYGLRALFAARGTLSRSEFHLYVESLNLKQNYAGFEVVNYAQHIQASEKRQLEEEIRRDTSIAPRGYPEFAIKPPGERPEYHVLVYLEPMQGNEFALGIDVRMVGARGRGMEDLRRTDAIISSGRLLSSGNDQFVGLSMRLPVHRQGMPLDTAEKRATAFIGSVGAAFNVRKLMAGVLDKTTMTAMRYRFFDAGQVGGDQPEKVKPSLLFDSAQTLPGVPKEDFTVLGAEEIFGIVLPLELAGRNWELHFSAAKSAFMERMDALLPWLVLAGGLLVSALVFGVLYGFSSSRARAVVLASEITHELRESEANLAHAQAQAHLGSWTLDLDTGAMNWSAETYRLLQLDPGAAAANFETFLVRLPADERATFKQAAEQCAATGLPGDTEFALRLSGVDPCWVHCFMQPLAGRGGTKLRGTIMDVTERKRALESQRANAAQIRDLLRRLVSVQEAERRGFSANLHDMVGQSLSVLGIGLETIRSLLPGAALKQTETTFNHMNQLLKDTMGSVRTVMSDLRPPLLDDYGLYSAIEWHARQFESRTGLHVAVEGAALEPRPAPEVELALFRIAQEALINVAKHASASRARISITGAAGWARLLVEDDGRGTASKLAANDPGLSGWGMAVMRERAAAVGGVMRIEQPGRGTRIVVEVGGDPHYPG